MRSEDGLTSVPHRRGFLGTVVACTPDPRQRARLSDALRNQATVRHVGSFAELRQFLRATTATFDLVVVPPFDVDGTEAQWIIREIAVERPTAAIVAYCPDTAQHSANIRGLVAAGAHQFIFSGTDESGVAFRAILAAARRACAADCVMQRLAAVIPPRLHLFMEAVLSRPDAVTTIVAVANTLGVHRKTLFNWCAHAGGLPPAELVAWCRLALAAHHLETTGCTIQTIAIELSYPSDTTLRTTMKRYTGFRASEIRKRGGVACVVQALERRLNRRAELHVE